MTFLSHTPEETQAFATRAASVLKGGEMLALIGNLGSGKTTFVQGLGTALGTDAHVRSPSFTLMNVYPTKHPVIRFLVHVDCYRLGAACDLEELELEEWLQRPDTVIAVEWPPEKLPSEKSATFITFESIDERTRKITIPFLE